MSTATNKGMEDIVAAQSAITWIDGHGGQLRYRGYPIAELAERCGFEQVAYLLWNGELPSETQTATIKCQLRALRTERCDLLDLVRGVPITAHPLDVLRYAVSWDALINAASWHNDDESNKLKSLQFTAWFPIVTAAFHRLRAGKEPVAPREDLDTAANFLFMLQGSEAGDQAIRTLDASLVLHADHEFNASTFAARVTIATQSNLHAAVASALGTLAGPRHGGASELVIQMLEDVGSPGQVEEWVQSRLAKKERIMGFGHRVYRTVDPRSLTLRMMAEKLLAGTPHEHWTDILSRLATVMERERGLYPNVDLYAAVVNHELGVEPAFYTSIFACSRITGWTAHAMEQLEGRMIRPVADYIGAGPRSLMSASSL